MLAGLLAALLSAVCYGIASVMQAIAVRAASRRNTAAGDEAARVDPGLVVRMLRQGPFIASLVIDLFGFVAQLIALRRLPLFAVQAIVASNLAVTAVCAAWLMKARLSLHEWLAVGGVVAGVGLLGASTGTEGATHAGGAFQLGLIVGVLAVGLAGLAVARLPDRVRTPLLGALAGIGYSILAVSARILPGFSPSQLIREPATYTLAAAGIVAFMIYAAALDGGSVTTATAAVVLLETMPAALVGVLLLGDTTRRGLAALGALGFAMGVACAVVLARFGEAGERQKPAASAPVEPDRAPARGRVA
jgi:drug/metabolite transporter (DMT)-like permease